jgi:hypothetical protein
MKPRTVLFFVSLFSILLSFNYNFFGAAGTTSFEKWQKDSEALIVGRLKASQDNGLFSYSGFPGSYGGAPDRATYKKQYELYNSNSTGSNGRYSVYLSQTGGQGWMFSAISYITPFTGQQNLDFLYIISSLIAAFTFAFLIKWVNIHYGFITALIVLLCIVFSKYLVVFGRNLWWVIWCFYAGFVYLIYAKRDLNSLRKIFLVSLSITLIKCFFTGFEYISTFLIMNSIPFFFWNSFDKLKIKTQLKQLFIYSIGSVTGVFIAMVGLIVQIGTLKGSLQAGIDHIIYAFVRRSHSDNLENVQEVYHDSLNSTVLEVLHTYLSSSFLGPVNFYMVFVVLIFCSIVLLTWERSKASSLNKSLVLAFIISFLAPLSWYVIFKAHSHVHTDMNRIVMYMPTLLFGFVIIGKCIEIVVFKVFKLEEKRNFLTI